MEEIELKFRQAIVDDYNKEIDTYNAEVDTHNKETSLKNSKLGLKDFFKSLFRPNIDKGIG